MNKREIELQILAGFVYARDLMREKQLSRFWFDFVIDDVVTVTFHVGPFTKCMVGSTDPEDDNLWVGQIANIKQLATKALELMA